MSHALFGCVLLVDDNDDDNFIHKRFLLRCAWADQVHVVVSAEEALALLPTLSPFPAVIFIDINMPIMNGFQLLERMAASNIDLSATRIVMLTSSLHPDDRASAENSPLVTAYINKPMNKQVLFRLRQELGT